MIQPSGVVRQGPLLAQLHWFTQLRWLAGAGVVCFALLDHQSLGLFPRHSTHIGTVGATILLYNIWLLILLKWVSGDHARAGGDDAAKKVVRRRMLLMAWAHLALDLACLSLLVTWTGGLRSPVLLFFVFHMVFASLMLPRLTAYAAASLAMLLVLNGLWVSHQWPRTGIERLLLFTWGATLLLTVWLANGIVRGLRRQRRRLARQNRRILLMSERLRRQQRGMIQQEKMAATGRMAAGVAHEIANPLASMDGLLQMLERRPERFKPESIETLRQQVARINRIVRQMTEFAHPGDGQWQVIGLNQVVQSAFEVLRFDPRAKRIEIRRELAEDMGAARIIPELMQQVVINLVINSLDAMEEVAEPLLILRTQQRGEQVALDIIDNGHGISPEHRRRIFEPFFTTKPVGKGTGLGLSIVYSLVKKHGGVIEVESSREHGTRFTVKLPLAGTAAAVANDGADGM